MGNTSTNGLESCLLTQREFANLSKGDRFDHRDNNGQFAAARILQKYSNNKAFITYETFDNKYNTTVNFKADPFSFAKYRSVSGRAATSSLKNVYTGDFISFRPSPNDNCQWRKGKIVSIDKYSGQVKVEYKNPGRSGTTKTRWTHLDNASEVAPLQATKPRNKQHNCNYDIDEYMECGNNQQNHGQYHYQQQQQQRQVQRQDQMTVRTQLLLDDTHKQVKLTKNYLEASAKHIDADELSVFNQKVVVGLTCFRMKVSGMRKNAEKEGLDFNDAFKGSSMIVKQFENECKRQFGGNKYLMQRLQPCLNYMRAVLKGKKNIPPLPYVNAYEFNEEVASSVISGINHAQNHVLPDRMNDINKNNKHYKKHQSQLKQEYENEIQCNGQEEVNEVNFNELIQDYNSQNIAFGQSKQEQDAIIQAQHNKYVHQAPDLVNMEID